MISEGAFDDKNLDHIIAQWKDHLCYIGIPEMDNCYALWNRNFGSSQIVNNTWPVERPFVSV